MNAPSNCLSIQMVQCYCQVLLSLLCVWVNFSSLDYKLLFIRKTTKGLVNLYLITYNKSPAHVSKNWSPLYQNVTKWTHLETHTRNSELCMNNARIRQRNRKPKVQPKVHFLPIQWLKKWVVRGMSPSALKPTPFWLKPSAFQEKPK